MTREEAIQYNKNLREYMRITDKKSEYKFLEENYIALDMAIKALEQEPCGDAVSVASVFEIMGNLMSIPYDFDRSITEKDVSESMDKVRELPRATPQEQMVEIDLYSVIKQKYIEREVLDNIRAEIWDLQYGDEEKSMTDEDRADAYNNAIRQVIEIIDKYKSESEGNK